MECRRRKRSIAAPPAPVLDDTPRSRDCAKGADAAPGVAAAPVSADTSDAGGSSRRATGEKGRTGVAYGFPNVATRSIRHSNSTRFSSMAGSRNA